MSLLDFDAPPACYAVMGNPISHSKSPLIHSRFAEQTAQRMSYEAIHVDLGGFAQAVGNFIASGGQGLNVTVPFKQEAWALVDRRSARAELAGAVNTIKVEEDGSLFGENTDGLGIVRDLTVNHRVAIMGGRVLILGAGGAVRGILEPLLEKGPAEVLVVNRTLERALELADLFASSGSIHGGPYEALGQQRFDIIINGTAASLQGELPPLPEGILSDHACCYDMMYGAEPTPFMRWASERGCERVLDGLGMLVEQAAESFALWRGVQPDTGKVIQALRAQLGA